MVKVCNRINTIKGQLTSGSNFNLLFESFHIPNINWILSLRVSLPESGMYVCYIFLNEATFVVSHRISFVELTDSSDDKDTEPKNLLVTKG